VPYFGICLGLQVACIEHARHVAGIAGATSSEFEPDARDRVIIMLEECVGVDIGGSMRLGRYECQLMPGTLARKVYGTERVFERHRHRYEVNNEYRERLERAGLRMSGTTADGALVEMIELPEHPWFLACQFHPEFLSRPLEPHPIFREFIAAAVRHRRERRASGDRAAAPPVATGGRS
jgi:CTP synthase